MQRIKFIFNVLQLVANIFLWLAISFLQLCIGVYKISRSLGLITLFLFSHREVFLDFDPVAISKLNEKKVTAPGSPATSLLSELKLRAMIENARQMCKVGTDFLFSLELFVL